MIRPFDQAASEQNSDEQPEQSWISDQVALMATAWERGDRVTAADIIAEHSDLDTESAIRLIYEETCLRREAGLEVDTVEVIQRYPQWNDELLALFDCDRLLRSAAEPVVFPEIGETIGPFQLLDELGRGASGRTFLAIDPTLADRPVVVKIIPDDQEEHLALARLRHTHIVPLFSEHAFPDRGLRLLCMPHLGGASLAQILAGLPEARPSECTGKLLADLIDRNTRQSPAPPPPEGPFRRRLEQASYPKAIVWIVACLADALHYAHARGLVHMDIKPSNVLITVDGQPMLLDFHLARPPINAGDWVFDRLGGTPGWMSPEQKVAMEAVAQGIAVPSSVDRRTDIYALGLMLREALLAPFRSRNGNRTSTSLAKLGLSVGLEDIINKCLAWSPDDRYDDAATLAEDLRRHFNDEPLLGVGNRSIGELWTKWRRRRPGSLAWGIAGITIAVASTVIFLAYRQQILYLEEAITQSESHSRAGNEEAAIVTLQRADKAASPLPGTTKIRSRLHQQIQKSQRSMLARQLNAAAEIIRYSYGIKLPQKDEAVRLGNACAQLWQRRDLLLVSEPGDPAGIPLEQIKLDLREIATIWTDLQLSLAMPAELAETRNNVKAILLEAEQKCGRSASITSRLESINDVAAPGQRQTETAAGPLSPWEHYDRGRKLLRSSKFEEARVEFLKTLAEQPDDFWSNFFDGECAFRLKRYAEAVAAFRTCVAIRPKSPICYYNRAIASESLGDLNSARHDYARALELDRKFVNAALNLGILNYKNGQLSQALKNFEQALTEAADEDTRSRIEYNLAVTQYGLGDRPRAKLHAEAAARSGDPEAITLRNRLRNAPATKNAPGPSAPAEPLKTIPSPAPRILVHSNFFSL